ncbi:hypothetical protein PV325_011151 [Microctonus aethiopoides]|nr:hypothetical protein PV325_011151 [Microctonus aethiopoides]
MNNAMINIFNNYSEYQLNIFVKSKKYHDKITIYDNIVILRRGHRLLTNICSRISNFYGTPILFSITYYSGIIVYYMYLVIGPFVNEKVVKNYTTESLNALLPLSLGIIAIVAITVYANDVVDEMGLIIDGINKLINIRLASREANWELEQFALEMLHRKLNFDACGVFSIDCTLLRSITSMTVTYLVLLVQTN